MHILDDQYEYDVLHNKKPFAVYIAELIYITDNLTCLYIYKTAKH